MTKPVAILNLTPDSFSDGGRHSEPQAALAAIERFIAEGAEVIDIGAESTRPGATSLDADNEWERLFPVLRSLNQFAGRVWFSLDTRHAETAAKARQYSVHWLNDVSGFARPEMIDAGKQYDRLVVMHSLTVPADKQITLPEDVDVVQELLKWAENRFARLHAHGIPREKIIFDPGIGFGKTVKQNWEIVRRVGELKSLGVPLFVGHSRKSFLAEDAAGRDAATLAVSRQLIAAGVDYIRIHDVEAHRALCRERAA